MVKLTKDVKDATEITKNFNKSLKEKLPFADDVDFENAERGLVESTDDVVIKGEKGNEVWNLKQYDFERKDSPDTVNPSLWRQTQLNLYNGLYKVTDRIYQIRSYDLSNMTIIEGDTGLIIIDPLVSEETARAGLELYFKNRGKKAVVAVIHTHIHFDHYGGVKGVISQEDVDSGKVEVIAPERFMEEVVGENLFAQNAMMIRTGYYSGAFLDRSQYGQVDIGLGKAGSTGTSSIIPPTKFVGESGTKLTIDGIEIEFHMANDTEAPVEFMMYYPQFKVLNAAEVVTHHIHNVLTLRGAKVRDARKWWKAINDLVNIYADKSEILIAQHHWPTWGTENIKDLLIKQRDAYKYLHDQTVRRFNLGYNPTEIAEDLKLPSTLEKEWSLRDYYGSFNHDSKAIFQFYIGWYD